MPRQLQAGSPRAAGAAQRLFRPGPDRTIAALAAVQHGVVTRGQLLDAGVPQNRIGYRVRTGRLRPLLRGVYGVGPLPAPHEAEMAAVLACGPTAVLSHTSAAGLLELAAPRPGEPVHVTVAGRFRRRGTGVRVHRVGRLAADEATACSGIPVTTAARTLLDLAAMLGDADLERAVASAERRRLVTPDDLRGLLARHPARPGTPRLRMLLGVPSPAFTRSEAESRFLRILRKAHLHVPETNVRLCGFEVDFLWRTERLVVEVDGYAYHSERLAFENDRRRDGILVSAGVMVIRVTWRQLQDEPEAVIARVAQALVSRDRGPGRASA